MFRKRRPPVGASPGTLIADKTGELPVIRMIEFNEQQVREFDVQNPKDLRQHLEDSMTIWVDIQGLGDLDVLRTIGEIFNIHPLALSDVVNIPQRPKADEYGECLFVVTSMIYLPDPESFRSEQVSIFLGRNFLLTFQERHNGGLNPVIERIRQGKGLVRRSGSDYLAYSILDTIIDGYYPVIERLGEYLEELEIRAVQNPSRETLSDIYRARRDLLGLRRSIFPNRELLNSLIRDEHPLIRAHVRPYLRDCYDHCAQVMDVIETFRDICSGLTDMYLSGLSNKLNEVMKVLTIISTTFIPISFLAAVYGMNFAHMPELKQTWGYPMFWAIAATIVSGMITFYANKGWIELPRRRRKIRHNRKKTGFYRID